MSALYFVFDVESIGIHGDAFAVAGGLYNDSGVELHAFAYHCSPDRVRGACKADRDWVRANVSIHELSIEQVSPATVEESFWAEWMTAKAKGAQMWVECGWPVEARFLAGCVDNQPGTRNWDGPYPLHEIATLMLAAGMDPMATYERLPHELPAHEPMADARLSARLLFEAMGKINEGRLS